MLKKIKIVVKFFIHQKKWYFCKENIEKLKSYNYKNSIASITKLRLKKLEKLYNYEYEIIE